MITADQLEALVAVYTRNVPRYNFATQERIDEFVESGHKCYGRTSGRLVFIVHRSPMTRQMVASLGDSLAEILFLLVIAGEESGMSLEEILDPETDRN